jgi:hypothetical protein
MPSKTKLHPATIRFDPELWERIERLAQADRRPVANYLALVIADAVDGRLERNQPLEAA